MGKSTESLAYNNSVGTQQDSRNITTLSIGLEKATGINRERGTFKVRMCLSKSRKTSESQNPNSKTCFKCETDSHQLANI